jgi:hypothetical protein
MGFSRPQLVVVSGLFLHDGIPAITKPFSRTFFLFSQWNFDYHEAFLTNFLSFLTTEFWLSRSLSHDLSFFFHDGILAITKPFSQTFFLFSQWNSGYHEAFLTNFLSFLTMEFWKYAIWGNTLFIYISQRVFT